MKPGTCISTLLVCACVLLTSCDLSSNVASAPLNADQPLPSSADPARGPAKTREWPQITAVPAARLKAIIEEVMTAQYGNRFDPIRSCWEYSLELNGIQGDYCMKPARPQVIQSAGERRLFFYASNRSDTDPGSPYAYGATEPGLMGAFALKLDSAGSWTYVAAEKAMPFGTAGDCGCDQAAFVKLDAGNTYGWLFSSGGIWQGTVVSNYSIVAPAGRKFRDLSAIPDVSEDDQTASHAIQVIAAADAKGLYPLRVIRQRDGKKEQELLIEFDPQKGVYALPAGQ